MLMTLLAHPLSPPPQQHVLHQIQIHAPNKTSKPLQMRVRKGREVKLKIIIAHIQLIEE